MGNLVADQPNPFDEQAARYDAWFDTPRGRVLFANELAAIRILWRDEFRPALEIGVGTGRFATALGIEDGVDPARGALRLAATRGIRTAQARGDALPYASGQFGAVLLVATLCFAENPARILLEAARVLHPDGHLVVGDIPAESAWGRFYALKGVEGHPFYRLATFYKIVDVQRMLIGAGFETVGASSTLAAPPDGPLIREDPRLSCTESCGFVCLVAARRHQAE